MIGAAKGDSRVQRLLDQLEWKYRIDSDSDFQVLFDVGEGRSQQGFIRSSTYSLGDLEIRDMFSVGYKCAGPLPANVANLLLQLNSRMKLGAWRAIRLESGQHLAMFGAQIAANTDANTLRTTFLAVLKTADDVEKELSGDDAF